MDSISDTQVVEDDTLCDTTGLSTAADLSQGTRVHRYLILGLVGKGGMGAVYKAYDPELDRRIALKILTLSPKAGETASLPQARLMREAQALAKLSHPNVVAVFDVGTYADGIYIAMEYVEGKTLREWLEQDQPTQAEILDVFVGAGRGLEAAHQVGIVHRDFKPENLLVGQGGQTKVLDFGLARAAGLAGLPVEEEDLCSTHESHSGDPLLNQPLTQVGTLIGTVVYMAPEHFLCQELDEKTDQFSFCVTLFEALFGLRPFRGKNQAEFEKNLAKGDIFVPEGVVVPTWIQQVVLKGLSNSKDDRHQDISTLLDALLHDPEEERRLRHAERKRRLTMIAIVLLAIILPIVVWYGLKYGTVLQCKKDVVTQKTGVWGKRTQHKIEQAFLRTNASYATSTWNRVRDVFERYLLDWSHKRSQLCESVWVGLQSEQLFDRKLRCFQSRLAEIRNLVKIFVRADERVVEKAIQASTSLSSVSQCLDDEALASRIALPNEKIASGVEAQREKLVEVKVLIDAGKYSKGKQLVEKVLSQCESLGYLPLRAEALFWAGVVEAKLGNYNQAEELLQQAYWEAVEADYLAYMALAGIRLIWVVGYRQTRSDEGLMWGWIAKTALVQLKWPQALSSQWHDRISLVYGAKDKPDQELLHLRKALEIDQQNLGPEHPEVGHRLNNLGVAYLSQEKYKQALDYYLRALRISEKALGKEHPHVAVRLNNIGLVYWKQAELEKALHYLRRALVIREDSLGRHHPLVTWPLSGIGEVNRAQGNYSEAIAAFERVAEICQKGICNPEPEGMAYCGLAEALWARDQDRRRALEFAQKARDVYAKAPTFRQEREAVESWMTKIRQVQFDSQK